MKGKNPLLQTLIAMTGQDNVITVHRPFVEFTGTLEAAMMLSQLLYWTPRSTIPGGWIAKSDKDWNRELCLARHSCRLATQTLTEMGIIETMLKKFNNSPTTHYRVDWEALEKAWTKWLRLSENRQTDCLKSDNEMSENEQSLTETTPETTPETTILAPGGANSEVPAEFEAGWHLANGVETIVIPDEETQFQNKAHGWADLIGMNNADLEPLAFEFMIAAHKLPIEDDIGLWRKVFRKFRKAGANADIVRQAVIKHIAANLAIKSPASVEWAISEIINPTPEAKVLPKGVDAAQKFLARHGVHNG